MPSFDGLFPALFIFSIFCLVMTIATMISEKITDINIKTEAEEWQKRTEQQTHKHHVIPLDD